MEDNKNMDQVEDQEKENAATQEGDKQPDKEKKPKLRQKIGGWLQKDKLFEVSPKVKKGAAIIGGGLITAGLAVGGVLLKQHLDSGAELDNPAGLLPEGEQPFELDSTDYVVSEMDQA